MDNREDSQVVAQEDDASADEFIKAVAKIKNPSERFAIEMLVHALAGKRTNALEETNDKSNRKGLDDVPRDH